MTIPTTSGHRRLRVAIAVAIAAVALAVVGWRLTGGQWQIIATPSMGQAAPVGTVVLTRPVDIDALRVGDIVTFHPPDRPDVTMTHRIVEVGDVVRTRGDVNGAADPWSLTGDDLVGVVVARWWGLGWLFRALPLLVVGGALVWGATRLWVVARLRTPVRVFAGSLVVAVCAVLLRPFVNLGVLMSTTGSDGTVMTVVGTGLMPVRVSATGGDQLRLLDGQVGTLTARPTDALGGFRVTSTPSLTWGWWLVLALLWSVPMLWCWWRSNTPPVDDDGPDSGSAADDLVSAGATGPAPATGPGGDLGPSPATGPGGDLGPWFFPTRRRTARHRHPPPRWRRPALLLTLTTVIAALTPESASAFTAAVGNGTTTAASSPYFTCVAADRGQNAWVVYSLSELLPLTLTAVTDSSVNNRTGSYNGLFANAGTRPCPRDTTPARAVTFGGTNSYVQVPSLVTNPQVFSIEIWFRTTTPGGRLIGFSSTTTGQSPLYDRHIYLTNSGQLVFGAFPNAFKYVTSPSTYADGNWHHVVGTLGPAGMVLYVDGAAVAADPTGTGAQVFNGYWRVGWENLATWPSVPTSYNYRGDLAFAAVYTSVLTAAQVRQNYAAGV